MIPLQKSFEHKKAWLLHVLRRLAAHISGKSNQLNMWCLRCQFGSVIFKAKLLFLPSFLTVTVTISDQAITNTKYNLLETMDWIICSVFVKFGLKGL
jgi:hypothetical protein